MDPNDNPANAASEPKDETQGRASAESLSPRSAGLLKWIAELPLDLRITGHALLLSGPLTLLGLMLGLGQNVSHAAVLTFSLSMSLLGAHIFGFPLPQSLTRMLDAMVDWLKGRKASGRPTAPKA